MPQVDMSMPQPQPVAAPMASAEAAPQSAPQPPLQYDQEQEYYDDEEQYDDGPEAQPVSWQAQEFVHQEKNVMWFVVFGLVIAAMLAVAVFLMGSITFAFVLVAIAAVVIVYANRPPRLMSYSLSEKGLYIGDTLHHFSDFKSFGVIHDGNEFSVMLIPTKRFQPGISVYFPEESGEDIVDILGSRLPMRELRLDLVDHLVRLLRL